MANLELALAAVQAAASSGCQFVVLPECIDYLGPYEELGETLRDSKVDFVGALAESARQAGIWLVAGSVRLPTGVDGRYANTTHLIAPDGTVHARYRKMHTFDVNIEGRVQFAESASVAPGDEVVVAAAAGAQVGLGICYDLRFPELFRAQRRLGANIIALPAAFTFETGTAHWDLLVRARAVENQCFVIAAGQFGDHLGSGRSYGRSMVVDPWGVVLAQAPDRAPAMAIADIDLSAVESVRSSIPMHPRLECRPIIPANA